MLLLTYSLSLLPSAHRFMLPTSVFGRCISVLFVGFLVPTAVFATDSDWAPVVSVSSRGFRTRLSSACVRGSFQSALCFRDIVSSLSRRVT